ncbi:MAG TPA: hypothetical protein VK003_11125, partial [Oceanobacillus sp.]|nr:hypothetical protein [Oceanobacillus sp.]
MKRIGFLALLILMVFGTVSAMAQDLICPPPPDCNPEETCPVAPNCIRPIGGVFTNPNWLKIDHHRVTVNIEDQIAHTE